MSEAKFYLFDQNNSGGFFDVNERVCHRVVIEANNADQAKSIFEPMVEDQSSSCPCCGDRWDGVEEININLWRDNGYEVSVYSHHPDAEECWHKLYGQFPQQEAPSWGHNSVGSKQYSGKIYFDSVEQYCQFLANAYGWTTPDVRIYYQNGTTKEFFTPENQ